MCTSMNAAFVIIICFFPVFTCVSLSRHAYRIVSKPTAVSQHHLHLLTSGLLKMRVNPRLLEFDEPRLTADTVQQYLDSLCTDRQHRQSRRNPLSSLSLDQGGLPAADAAGMSAAAEIKATTTATGSAPGRAVAAVKSAAKSAIGPAKRPKLLQ